MKLVLFAAAFAAIVVTTAAHADTLVYAGTLLAKPGEAPLHSQTIVIANDRIKAVQAGFTPAKAGDQVIDLKNRFVLPGLFDCHLHLLLDFNATQKLDMTTLSPQAIALRGAYHAGLDLRAGFTTVRDLGEANGSGDAIFALRDAIAKGWVAGPRVYAAGALIAPTGGHGQIYGYREDIDDLFMSKGRCDGPIECRKVTRLQVARGANVIKLASTGGVLSDVGAGTGQQFEDDEIQAIVQTAHRLGRKVAVHAHGTDGINAALRAGADSIEHGTFMDDESIRLFKEHHAYYVPTVVAGVTVAEEAKIPGFFPPAIRDKALAVGPHILETLRKAHNAGVKIAFGTDTGVSPHGQNAREFELMVQAGLTPMEAIKAATVSAADLVGVSKDLGTIEPGKYADLVATAASPLDSVSELRHVRFVMKAGTVFKQE
jgi:imidazolonepropionase-like amidohydrolase